MAALVASLMPCGVSLAHDYWIEPARFRVPLGERVDCDLKVGFGDEVDVLPWRPLHCERAVARLDDEEFEIAGEPDRTPALSLAFARPGTWTLSYRSFESRIELGAEKFEHYLREEGLDRVIAERIARDEGTRDARELYSRCAKSLVAIGDVTGVDLPGPKAIGLPLELVAELDPYTLSEGRSLPVTLLLRGKPLANALVEATRMDPTHRTLAARTDASGRVEFALEPGPWMITAVDMERAPNAKVADWRSLWATLTFERAGTRRTVDVSDGPTTAKDEPAQ